MSKLDGTVLCGFPWKTHLVYLVDVLIYSHSFSEHLQDLEEIHYRLKSSGVNLNPCKMLFHQGSSTVFLAMLYPRTAAGHTPKMRSVQDWPTPHSAAQVRAYLGLCSYTASLCNLPMDSVSRCIHIPETCKPYSSWKFSFYDGETTLSTSQWKTTPTIFGALFVLC